MVLGLTTPTSGAVRVFGKKPARAIADGQVAAALQTGGLLRDITVGETVELTAALFGRTGSAIPYLERAGIAALAGRKVGKCSGGQQQRLRFAMALVSNPTSCCSTSPPRAWTCRDAVSSGRRSGTTPRPVAPSCSRRTTWRRPTPTRTG